MSGYGSAETGKTASPEIAPTDARGDDSDGVFDAMAVLFSMEAAADPLPHYADIRQRCPVAQTKSMMGEGADNWLLSTYEDVMWALRHPEVFSSSPDAVNIGQEHNLIPLQVDPPDHAKYRRTLDPEFSPKRMAALEADVRLLVGEIIDRFVAKGSCDFHEDFATPMPSTVFLRLMGMPQSDLPQFLEWRDSTIRPDLDPNDPDSAQKIREATGRAITKYFERAIALRRAEPDDNLLSRIVHAQVDGRSFTDDELLGICHLMLLAGLDTVTATLDCMIAYLAQHPEQRQLLVDRPELIDGAIEEMLRTETPVTVVARVVKQEHVMRGCTLKPGDGVTVGIGAANGDAEFADPHVVDFQRQGNRHLAFGAGPHRCLGSHLARMELRVALEEFHKRIPNYSVADGATLLYSPAIRQTFGLPLQW